jgi:hypothetical protein
VNTKRTLAFAFVATALAISLAGCAHHGVESYPTYHSKPKVVTVPDVAGLNASVASSRLNSVGFKASVNVVLAQGQCYTAIGSKPRAGAKAPTASIVTVDVKPADIPMPNIVGASPSTLSTRADLACLKYTLTPADGIGNIISQSIAPGQNVPAESAVVFNLTPPPTVAQQQALSAAKSYLSMGSGFSAASLLDQLTSPYGNGFAQADAQWAVDNSGADWNAQAVMAAKGYLNLGGFSRSSMIEQLTSQYGNQFTEAQAEYACDQVGLH